MRIAAVSTAYAPRDSVATRSAIQQNAERLAVATMPVPVPTTPGQVMQMTGKGLMVDVVC